MHKLLIRLGQLARSSAHAAAQSLQLPQCCLICAATPQRGQRICADCEQALPWLPPGCHCCGLRDETLLPGENLCRQCQATPPQYDRCLALFDYQPPASLLISRFKYRHALAEGSALAQLLSAGFARHYEDEAQPMPDCLLPVPLHHWRLRRRGFNQSVILARQISRDLHIPVDLDSLHRPLYRRAQQGQDRRQRQHNISGQFALSQNHQLHHCRHIAIIDDVVTTGATANAVASVLRQVSQARVDLWCLARVANH